MFKFAVVDIETTGLVHQGHAITEIAVVHVDEGGITPVFHSLLTPMRSIPSAVSHLTGITSALTAGAPTFAEKADEIMEALRDRIFVAHQVNFDYSFLKKAFELEGLRLRAPRLCTVRLSRRALPQLRSSRLQQVCAHLGVYNYNPHRALGDALATANVLRIIAAMEEGKYLKEELSRANKPAIIPAQLLTNEVNNIPELPGVYYFFGALKDRPIYVGKAINLRKRVLSHFTAPDESRRKQCFQREISRVDFRTTSSEYMAWLLEDVEIKRHRPLYNVAQKERSRPQAVRLYEARSGLQRLAVVSATGHPKELALFATTYAARQWLIEQVKAYGFDPLRAGMAMDYGVQHASDPNEEEDCFSCFIEHIRAEKATMDYALIEPHSEGAAAFVLVQKGQYKGFGQLAAEQEITKAQLESVVQVAPDSNVARAVLRKMLLDKRIKKIQLT